MKNNINKILYKLGHIIRNNSISDLDLETCALYIDGKLNKKDIELVENYILSNDHIQKLINEAINLKAKSIRVSPPLHLHEKIIESLEYNDKSIFDIAISLVKGKLNIIKGNEWIVPTPHVAFRNGNTNKINLKTNINNLIFEFKGRERKGQIHARFYVKEKNGTFIKNIRFDLFINDKVLNSQVTNKNGSTSIFTFENGEYYFKIYQKSNLLGKVNFCLSINE